MLKSAQIIGIDNMNAYYNVSIKKFRLNKIDKIAKEYSCLWTFIKRSIADKMLIDKVFEEYNPDIVVNLAAKLVSVIL